MPLRSMNRRSVARFCLLIVFVCFALTSGISQTRGPEVTQPDSAAQHNPSDTSPDTSLRLGPGDLVEFSVYNVPELASKTRVSSNGDVYLPLIDYVHLAGLTLEEAQALLEKRYADGGFLKDPHVN